MVRMALLAILLLPASGCIFDIGKCRYEIRSLVLSGTLAGTGQPAGEPAIEAELSLNEARGGPDYRIFTIMLRGFSTHSITSVDVVDAADGGATILARFTVGNITEPGLWYADIGNTAPAPTNSQLKWPAIRRDLRLVARYGSNGTAEGTVRMKEDGDWERPYCS